MVWAEWHRRKMLHRLGDKELVKSLMPLASAKRRWLKFILMQLALALVILMLARPQMGTKVSNEKRNGIEAIICLDISNSMLAEDVTPSRLQKSKMLVENLVEHFSNDKIGLIVFAGDAFVQLPITSDYVSAKMFLQNIDPSLIQTQGTDIAGAINLASNSFTQQKNIGKAIIVITDGEDHEGGAKEAAKAARDKGFRVFILGIGNTTGAPIPVNGGGYLQDNSGNTVMTALNEQMCREIASAGSGTYIHVDNTSTAQEQLNDEISKMQKGEMESVVYSEYNEQFQSFGLLAIILLIMEVLISEAVNPWFSKFQLFKKAKGVKTMACLALLMTFAMPMNAQQDRSYIRQGNRQMRGGAEDGASNAEVSYRKAMAANASNPQALYNLGCALMAQQKDSAAMEAFQKSAKLETSKNRRAMSYHNMGVILQRHQQYGEAITQYKQALRLKPSDNETRYNLVLCQRQQKKNQQNQNNNSGGGSDDKKNDKKDKEKDKQKDQNNQDKQNQDNQDKKDEKPQNRMSKENAEQLLNAAMQDEKQTQQRLKKAMSQPKRKTLDKNW